MERAGIRVETAILPPGVQGSSQGGRILLAPGQDSRRRILTLVHELSHELAHHGPDKPVGTPSSGSWRPKALVSRSARSSGLRARAAPITC